MESVFKYGGWVLSVVLIVVAANLYVSRGGVTPPAESVAETAPVVSESMPERLAGLEDELARAKEEAASLRVELDAARRELAESAARASGEITALQLHLDAVREHVAESTAAAEAPTETDGSEPDRGERIADAQMGFVADMAYQDLFNELGLPPEIRDQVRGLIASHLSKAQRATMAALQSKGQSAKEVHAQQEAMEAELRAELEGLLSPEELAAWDEYSPVADQVMYERLVEGQLNMMAAGLGNENRTIASQVMAEELVREFDVFNGSDETYSMDSFNDAQARALTASLDRLETAMELDQYVLVEGFVNQALTMFEAMSEEEGAE